MSEPDDDIFEDAIERLEWDERKEDDTRSRSGGSSLAARALTGGAAGIAAMILEACGSSSQQQLELDARRPRGSGSSAAVDLRLEPELQVHARQPRDDEPVLHADPERRGGRLQAARLHLSVDRLGRPATSREMVNAINSAVSAGVDGIGVALVDPHAFNAPRRRRSTPGSRSSPTTRTQPATARLAYIGQDLFVSGQEMGEHIVDAGARRATSRCSSPRRARSTSSRGSTARWTRSSRTRRSRPTWSRPAPALPQELSTIDSYIAGAPEHQGLFAVDGGQHPGRRADDPEAQPEGKGSRAAATTYPDHPAAARRRLHRSSRSTSSPTCRASSRSCSCTCTRRRRALTGIADVNTGLKFLDKTTVVPYNSTKSRYEGTEHSAGRPEGVGRSRAARAWLRRSHGSADATAGDRRTGRAQRRAGPVAAAR